MKVTSDKLNTITEQFVQDIKTLFPDGLVSVCLYGSAVTEDFDPDRSNINFLVALTPEALCDVRKVQPIIKKWQKKRIAMPLFLSELYIEASLDSFPIEFLNMQHAYKCLEGKDVLKAIQIDPADLRLQCERELKGKLLHLRHGYIHSGGKKRPMLQLISESLTAFTAIFRALLVLKGENVPGKKSEILFKTCNVYGHGEDVFRQLVEIRSSGKIGQVELMQVMEAYIQAVEKIGGVVDEM